MVAISLYRGNLHKVPEVPRRWTTPKPTISHKDFKILLLRRSRALSRLPSPVATTSASIPNPNPCPNPTDTNSCSVPVVNGDNNESEIKLPPAEDLKEEERGKEEGKDAVKQLGDEADALLEGKNLENVKSVDKIDFPSEPEVGARINTVAVISDKEKRIKEVKEKLEILNEKKHSLVQVLKQILNAEEQLKSSSTQENSGQPPLPLQVDTATDSGSMTRINNPRMCLDGNQCGDTDGEDADDGVNHNLQPSQLPHMNSTSPSSDSQQRKVALNMLMPHSYRTTLTVAGSPRRFAPTAGVPGPSSVSASGTSYIVSSPSPSPAASGGTSVFRDVRLPSPWN